MENKLAAILCSHVVDDRLPILFATRTEPENDADSGWQFLCNTGVEEKWQDAKVGSIDEVLQLEPSLQAYIELPAGTTLIRENDSTEWQRVE